MFLYHESGVVVVSNIAIKRGIFQGDALSPLLFILALNPLSLLINRRCRGYNFCGFHICHIMYMDDIKTFSSSHKNMVKMALLIEKFSSDIGMELGLSKCKVVNLVAGRYAELGGVVLESGGVIDELREDGVYKYLGIKELDGFKHEQMKENVMKAAKGKLRKLLETELNSRNVIVAINECILPIISYSFAILNWREQELKDFDVQVRKLMTMYRMFSIRSDVDRLYMPRKKGGRGLMSVWDSFRSNICRIAHVLQNSENQLLTACCAVDKRCLFSNIKRAQKYECELPVEYPENFLEVPILTQAKVKARCIRASITEQHVNAWKEKPQHGAFIRRLEVTPGVDLGGSFSWLASCHLVPHSESYVFAAQELALITRFHEKHILKSRSDDACRICRTEPETISHILFGCDQLSKREYLSRHNNVCRFIHHSILKAYGIPCGDNWFTHSPKEVVLQNNVEVVYDQTLQTARPIGANRPDIVVRDLSSKKALVIDIACPNDINVIVKEAEKISKYQSLCAELRKLWGVDCEVVPVVVGGLGVISKNLGDHLARIPGCPKRYMCQKIAMLGSERILRSVLSRR